MSESKYTDAWKKGFDSGVESQRQSCLLNCDKDFDEFAEGYNQALEEYKEKILYNVSLSDSQRKVIEQVCDKLKKIVD